ncbi:helix-hairpin-helix domain-containing protein [Roseateles sp. SL47]|uniref:helix-hairpin-helix domain-containing protein n=1 Tax=Roseateles sp. SL47 TaxID=2995138 RepID=UPI00226F82D4|nr:helix-hairpin-helix domain-containing protein [Roseateles sp. SL47]WAC75109.1 helix-hairpin-helix domain-containing protein [Roseateles sp. SL47]
MSPDKVDRARVRGLTDLPNVGSATAKDLERLGIRSPEQLVGADPLVLFRQLCEVTGVRHDPCTLDVFMSAVSFMDGGQARAWWAFTEHRKRLLAARS